MLDQLMAADAYALLDSRAQTFFLYEKEYYALLSALGREHIERLAPLLINPLDEKPSYETTSAERADQYIRRDAIKNACFRLGLNTLPLYGKAVSLEAPFLQYVDGLPTYMIKRLLKLAEADHQRHAHG